MEREGTKSARDEMTIGRLEAAVRCCCSQQVRSGQVRFRRSVVRCAWDERVLHARGSLLCFSFLLANGRQMPSPGIAVASRLAYLQDQVTGPGRDASRCRFPGGEVEPVRLPFGCWAVGRAGKICWRQER